jgi:hypothetical protein
MYSFRCCLELDHASAFIIDNDKNSFVSEKRNETIKNIKNEAEIDSKVVDEVAGVLWRHVYLKNEDLLKVFNENHVLSFAKFFFFFFIKNTSVNKKNVWQ